MLFLTICSLEEAQAPHPVIQGLELRLDKFKEISFEELVKLQKSSPLPLLFTLRSASQGGGFQGTEKKRLELIEQLFQIEPAFFDLEYDTPVHFLEKMRKKHPAVNIVLSYHSFEEKPVDPQELLAKIHSPHATHYKIACHVDSSLDALRLCAVAKNNVCAIGMGKAGEITRILSPVTGNLFNFACQKEDLSPAQQLTATTLEEIYNYSRLTPKTSIFALLGDPVDKSPSHETHNAAFRRLGIDAVYVKIPLKSSELAAFFAAMRALPFRGFSVTMPHKEAVIPFLDELSPDAQNAQAVNTILVQNGKLYGTNTDGKGALDALGISVQGKKILLLGAGATARAIACEAKLRGANLIILNRTKERAEALARAVGGVAGGLESAGEQSYDILINATSVGMGHEALPIDPNAILPHAIVMDVVHGETRLLQEAKKRGCRCISGREVFTRQADRQFGYWFDLPTDCG